MNFFYVFWSCDFLQLKVIHVLECLCNVGHLLKLVILKKTSVIR